MATEKRITGNLGEDFAGNYFKRLGFTVERNFHSRYGEIDVIAQNEEYVIFVEVKTRSDGTTVAPWEAVDIIKQKKICLTASEYMMKYDCEKQPRFDVFEVWQTDGRIYKFNHIPSAFDFIG